MFSKLKEKIKELAKNAVLVAEAELGTGQGQEKKQMAINYIVKNLPLPEFLKNIISIILSKFIDEAVEMAVSYMNALSQEQEQEQNQEQGD